MAWGLRREMTNGKARIPMARPRVVVPQMGDKIGFIKFNLFLPNTVSKYYQITKPFLPQRWCHHKYICKFII